MCWSRGSHLHRGVRSCVLTVTLDRAGWTGQSCHITAPRYGTVLWRCTAAPCYGVAQRQQATPPCTTSASHPAPRQWAAGSRAVVWMFTGSHLRSLAPKKGWEPPTPSPSLRALVEMAS